MFPSYILSNALLPNSPQSPRYSILDKEAEIAIEGATVQKISLRRRPQADESHLN
jgi:hypothetical protein